MYYQQSFMDSSRSKVISLSHNQFGLNRWRKNFIVTLDQPILGSNMLSITYFATDSITKALKWFKSTSKSLKLTVQN